MSTHFDLIAIGGGSGGLATARAAVDHGAARVALVEADRLGGTCVNRGCVPKKLMWHAAEFNELPDLAAGYAVGLERTGVDWARLVERRDAFIASREQHFDDTLRDSGIRHLRGRGRLAGPGVVDVDGTRYTADHIVLAPGSAPIVPSVPGAELGITSDDFFRLRTRPERIAIVGAGYIGVELAGMLRALGSAVTLVSWEDQPLESFDPLLRELLRSQLAAHGVNLHMPFAVQALEQTADALTVHGTDGRSLRGFDTVLWAVGRRPQTAELGLDTVGLHPANDGHIPVDAYQNTAVDGVYAIGDVTGQKPLTPVAVAAGRTLARRLFGDDPGAYLDYERIPTVVFAHPPLAAVGLTETEARAEYGDAVRIYQTRFRPLRQAFVSVPRQAAVKLVCIGPEDRVVGLHLIGDGADEILQGFAVALRMGATKADFERTVAIHPTNAEEIVTLR